MSKHSKWVALALAVAMLATAGLMAGCSSSTPKTTGTTGTTPEKATVKTVTAGSLIVGSDTAFPPFESMNGTVAEGFDVDIADAIAKDLGLKMEFKSYKFDTLIPTLKAGGKFDIIMSGMTINADRRKEIDFSSAYIDSNQSISVKNDSTVKAAADLAGKRIGVQSGTTGQQWAKENIPTAVLVPFDDTLAAFSALQAGKVDAVVNDLPVSAAVVKDAARGLKIVQEIPTGEQYGIAVAKTNPELLKAVNGALVKLKSDGTYDTIYKKWFGVAPSSK